MELEQRKDLTEALAKLTGHIADDIKAQVRSPGPAQERARALHRDEKVGEDFIVWTDVLSRRAAVLWVLKTVYVRVLEDRGLLSLRRLVDPDPKVQELESEKLFHYLAPKLGPTAYLTWVFRDLASARGGLPELFSLQPAEVARPSDANSQELLNFWRRRNTDTSELIFRFDGEHFDGRLMGDLYQDLDPVVKQRYALLQTPDFVLDFILDETLTPAIAELGVEKVKVLDPACGSGHFLLAAFKRLVKGTREKFPARLMREVVGDCLGRVVGIDLNDYACGLARARLVMTALEMSGETSLAAASDYHPQVYWADALEQVERDPEPTQLDIFTGEPEKKPYAMLTRPEVRARMRPILKSGFEVVVGNPPYDTERDPLKREYHREKIGKERRYLSAHREYSLAAVFIERMFQLGGEGAFVGVVTSNSFARREFGRPLIERVLPAIDLTKIVDVKGVQIPNFGSPAIIIYGRNRAAASANVVVVGGKRGEPGSPKEPAQSKVWLSILEGHDDVGFDNDLISVVAIGREVLSRHPWSIGGGDVMELKDFIEGRAECLLSELVEEIGAVCITRADPVYFVPERSLAAAGAQESSAVNIVEGDAVRDWAIQRLGRAIFPFSLNDFSVIGEAGVLMFLWPFRTLLWTRKEPNGDHRELGKTWWEWSRFLPRRFTAMRLIAFAEVSSHGHFVLGDSRRAYTQTAPVMCLGDGVDEEGRLSMVSMLNSAVAEFWMKRVFKEHGDKRGGGRVSGEPWQDRYQRDGTKLKRFPFAVRKHPLLSMFGEELSSLAGERVRDAARVVVDAAVGGGVASLAREFKARRARDELRLARMVGLQEELDWLCYRLYGIAPDVQVRRPEEVRPLLPGQRPFEIVLARENSERRATLARGEVPDETPTVWFERHGWEPVVSLETIPSEERCIIEERMAHTAANRNLSLVEQPTYKRRWYRPDYAAEERQALELYLADRMEVWAKGRTSPFNLRQFVAALQADAGVLAVAEYLAGSAQFDLEALLVERLRTDSVPNNKHHVFKPSGLDKRAAWEATWEMQRREDAGENVTPPVPPKYTSADYLRSEYDALRGSLDVPLERFIVFTEVPGRDGAELLYGWAGWTPRQRAKVFIELDEEAEGSGIPVADRYGLLYGAQFLVPYVAWESKDAAAEFDAVVRNLVGKDGVTEKMLAEWAERFPASRPRTPRTRRRTA